jgi:arylsulfatase A-like enzyme
LETYDAAVRRADRGLGALLDALEQRDRRDGLLLVVVSDHGESLGREPARHGTALVQPQIHIPLIFWARDALRPREIATPVGLADVTPTLLDLFGLRPIEEAGGESLRPLLEGGREPVHDFVPASLLRFVWAPLAPQRFSLVAADGRKLIVTSEGDTHRFRLAEDPAEQNAVAEPWPGIESALTRWREDEAKRAAAFRARHGDLSSGVIEAEEAARLRALGYLE